MGMKYGDGPVLFYTWLIPHCDDAGTITADPWELLGIVWAARRDKTEEDVRQAIAACEEFGLIERSPDGRRLQMPVVAWYRYQSYIPPERRRAAAEDPRPPAHNAADPRSVAQDAAESREAPQNPASLSVSLSVSDPVSLSPSDPATGNDPPSHEDPPQGSPSCSPPRGGQRATPPQAGEYPPEFEAAWSVYPRHDEKRAAYAAWHARVREGVSPAVLAAAARHYAAHVADRNPRYVKLGKTFWGPHRPYEDYVTDRGPPGAAEPSAWAALRAALEGGDDR